MAPDELTEGSGLPDTTVEVRSIFGIESPLRVPRSVARARTYRRSTRPTASTPT